MVTLAATLLFAAPQAKPEVAVIQERKAGSLVRAWDLQAEPQEPADWGNLAIGGDNAVEILVRIPWNPHDAPSPSLNTKNIKGLRFQGRMADFWLGLEDSGYYALNLSGKPMSSHASFTVEVAQGVYTTLALGRITLGENSTISNGFKAKATAAARRKDQGGKSAKQTLLLVSVPARYASWDLVGVLSNDKGDEMSNLLSLFPAGQVEARYDDPPTKTMRLEVIGRKFVAYPFTGIPLKPKE